MSENDNFFGEEPTNVWEYRIEKVFSNKSKESSVKSQLWEIVNLILYENAKDRTLIDIYNLLDKESFVKLISLLDGRTFQSPSKKELEETLLLAVLYYEKEIEGKSWREIQKEYDFEIPTIKYGIRIRNLDTWIRQKIQEIVRQEDNTDE
jgi:hypothetical protein